MNTSVDAELDRLIAKWPRVGDPEAVLEIIAAQERDDLDEAHGKHILGMVGDTPEHREAANRALLDALHRPEESGGDDAP